MNTNIFDGYITKVLNNDETEILKKFFSSIDTNSELKFNNFQMLYMPNFKITIDTLKNNNKEFYFLSDTDSIYYYFVQHKLSLKTLLNTNFSFMEMHPSSMTSKNTYYVCSRQEYKQQNIDLYTHNFKYKSNHVYNEIKKRLHYTFMLLNYIIMPDIAKYLFLMYYEVAFG